MLKFNELYNGVKRIFDATIKKHVKKFYYNTYMHTGYWKQILMKWSLWEFGVWLIYYIRSLILFLVLLHIELIPSPFQPILHCCCCCCCRRYYRHHTTTTATLFFFLYVCIASLTLRRRRLLLPLRLLIFFLLFLLAAHIKMHSSKH